MAKKQQKTTVLDHYKGLMEEDEQVRVKSAAALIRTLQEKDSEDDWQYALQRLLKGLSSTKAQRGFMMALGEVLELRKEQITVFDYLDKCEKFFRISNGAKGQEERGMNFGRLFAIQCLIQSSVVAEANEREVLKIVDTLLNLANHKVWLREPCFAKLCDLVDAHNLAKFQKNGLNVGAIATHTLTKVEEQKLTLSAEGVALYLSLGKLTTGVEIPNGWKENDPLAKGNLQTLSKSLKEITVGEEKQKGSWKPQINFVWPKLMVELLSSTTSHDSDDDEHRSKKHKSSKKKKSKSNEKEKGRVGLEEFWKVVVDEGLFSANSSNERKFWGFEVFSLFAQQHASDVEPLLSQNLLRTLTNQLAASDRFLNKAAKRSVQVLVESCATAAPQRAATVATLLLDHAPNFDQKTKTKTVEQLIPLVPVKDLRKIVKIFTAVVANPADEKADVKRQWALDYLLNMIKSRSKNEAHDEFEWIEDVVGFVARCAFFTDAVDTEPEFSDRVIEVCQQRLSSIMAILVSVERNDKKTWPFYAIELVNDLVKEGKTLRTEFEEELLKVKDKSTKTLLKIRRKRMSTPHADSTQLKAFELLFSLVLLQVYAADVDAAAMLDELQACYNKIIGKNNYREGDDEEDMDASEVLTEILLSFLSRKSSLLRRLSETVWETFTSQISLNSLGLLYNVLDTRENLAGQNDMFNNEDDMDIDEENEEEGDEEEDDEKEEEEEEEDSDEEDEEEEEEEEDDVEKVTKRKLAAALGITQDEDGEVELSSDSERDTDDEESMDDDQMMALDDKIAEIFREQKKAAPKPGNQKKQEAKDARENVTQLKARVLDLLEIYVKVEDGNYLAVSAVVPLLRLMRTTRHKQQVGDKAHNLLKLKVCKPKALPQPANAADADELLAILQMVHEEAAQSNSKPHSFACNQSAVFVSKLLMNFDKQIYAPKIVEVYSKSMVEFVQHKNSKVLPAMFNDFINWCASIKK